MHPQQFEHGVVEEKTPVGGALLQMRIGRPFDPSKRHERIRHRRSDVGADEKMIHLEGHHDSPCEVTEGLRKTPVSD